MTARAAEAAKIMAKVRKDEMARLSQKKGVNSQNSQPTPRLLAVASDSEAKTPLRKGGGLLVCPTRKGGGLLVCPTRKAGGLHCKPSATGGCQTGSPQRESLVCYFKQKGEI